MHIRIVGTAVARYPHARMQTERRVLEVAVPVNPLISKEILDTIDPGTLNVPFEHQCFSFDLVDDEGRVIASSGQVPMDSAGHTS